jgi:UDP-galactose transporter B1
LDGMISFSMRSYLSNVLFQIPLISKAYKRYKDHPQSLFEITYPREVKFTVYVLSLYAIFITWGYLQEKITSTSYDGLGTKLKWDFPIVLNILITLSAGLTGLTFEHMFEDKKTRKVPFIAYWKVAISSALASPIGYFSLKFVSFPMMILSKSSKHVPVMLIGKFWYHKHYEFYRYISVALICGGIFVFSLGKGHSKSIEPSNNPTDDPTFIGLSIGLFLILLNLSLDGITSNEQDRVFQQHSSSSYQMMKNTNFWQSIYLGSYLLLETVFRGTNGQFFQSIQMLTSSYWLTLDVFIFCVCACIGQVLLFTVIQEFGSLVWITVSVTRQLFTVLLSVFLFKHQILRLQWAGILSVFLGLGVDLIGSYFLASKKTDLKGSADDIKTKNSYFQNNISSNSNNHFDIESNHAYASPNKSKNE